MTRGARRVLAVGVDAAEVTRVEPWLEDGTLPNLRRLRNRGAWGRLASTADWLTGTPWPTFYTGIWPADHGFYCYLQWRPESMDHLRPSADWLPMTPFWRTLGGSGCRPVAVDIPLTYPPEPFDGVEIGGWAGHDKFWPPASNPPELLREIRRQFGPPPVHGEISGRQTTSRLLELRDQLIGGTERVTDLVLSLLDHEDWDLFLVALGATHRGGHKLWDITGTAGPAGPAEAARLERALRDVYVACDTAVGRIVSAVPDDATILVFALHGMGRNTSLSILLPEMLDRVLKDECRDPVPVGHPAALLDRARQAVPVEVRGLVKRQLPQRWQDRLTLFWRRHQRSGLSSAPAFCLTADLEGYVRLNLQGREAMGFIDPADHDDWCHRISDGLRTFVDADTGQPVISEIRRGRDLYPVAYPKDLPDLVVQWEDRPAADRRMIESPRYGAISWPTPGRNPDGRSGHHRPEGWLIGVGEPFAPGSTVQDGHILDLAPTILDLLGQPRPDAMRGRVLVGWPRG